MLLCTDLNETSKQVRSNEALKQFIVELIRYENGSFNQSYAQVWKKYPVIEWIENGYITCEKIFELIERAVEESVKEVLDKNSVNFILIIVLNKVLMCIDQQAHNSNEASLICYVLWNRVVGLYHSLSISDKKRQDHNKDRINQNLEQLFSLVKQYLPLIQNVLLFLSHTDNKATRDRATRLAAIGLWKTYISTYSICLKHAEYQQNNGKTEDAANTCNLIVQNFKQHMPYLKALQKVDPATNREDININLKSLNLIRQSLKLEDLIAECTRFDTLKLIEEKTFFDRYKHIFEGDEGKKVIDLLLENAKRTVPNITKCDIKDLLTKVYVLHFLLTHDVLGKSNMESSKSYIVFLLTFIIAVTLNRYINEVEGYTTNFNLRCFELTDELFSLLMKYSVEACQFYNQKLQNKKDLSKKYHEYNHDFNIPHAILCSKVAVRYCMLQAHVYKRQALQSSINDALGLNALLEITLKNAKMNGMILQRNKDWKTNSSLLLKLKQDCENVMIYKDTFYDFYIYLQKLETLSNENSLEVNDIDTHTIDTIFKQIQIFLADRKYMAIFDYLDKKSYLLACVYHKISDHSEAVMILQEINKLFSLILNAFTSYVASSEVSDKQAYSLYLHLITAKVESVKQHIQMKVREIQEEQSNIPACEMIEKVIKQPKKYTKNGNLTIYQEFKDIYFKDSSIRRALVNALIQYLDNSKNLSDRGKINISHFMLQALSLHEESNDELLCMLWEYLGNALKNSFMHWENKKTSLHLCYQLYNDIHFYLDIGNEYQKTHESLLKKVSSNRALNLTLTMRLKGKWSDAILFQLGLRVYTVKYKLITSNPEASLLDEFQQISSWDQYLSVFTLDKDELNHGSLQNYNLFYNSVKKALDDTEPNKNWFTFIQNLEDLIQRGSTSDVETKSINVDEIFNFEDKFQEQNFDKMIKGFETILAPSSYFEREDFYQGFLVYCSKWIEKFTQDDSSNLERIIAIKLIALARKVSNLKSLQITTTYPEVLSNVFEEFIKEAECLPFINDDNRYQLTFERYKRDLFTDRATTYKTIESILIRDDTASDCQSKLNLSCFLLQFIFPEVTKMHGSFQALQDKIQIYFLENLYATFQELNNKLLSKQIEQGQFVAFCNQLDTYTNFRDLFKDILLIAKEIIAIHKITKKEDDFAKIKHILQIALKLKLQYTMYFINSGCWPESKIHYQDMIYLVRFHDENIKSLDKEIFELEKKVNLLAPCFGQNVPKNYVVLKLCSTVLLRLMGIDDEFLIIIKHLSEQPKNLKGPFDFLDLKIFHKAKSLDQINSFLQKIIEIQEPKFRLKTKESLDDMIHALHHFKNLANSIQNDLVQKSIVKELIVERIDSLVEKIILAKTVAWEAKQEEKNEKKQITSKVAKTKSTTENVKSKLLEEPPHQNEDKLDENTQKEIDALFIHGQKLSLILNTSNLPHQYRLFLKDSRLVKVVVSKALVILEDLAKSNNIESVAKRLNLSFFMLTHFVDKLSDNKLKKQALLKHIWPTLKKRFSYLLQMCHKNRPIGGNYYKALLELTQVYEIYMRLCDNKVIRRNHDDFPFLDEATLESYEALFNFPDANFELLKDYQLALKACLENKAKESSQDENDEFELPSSKSVRRLCEESIKHVFGKLILQDRKVIKQQLPALIKIINTWLNSQKSKDFYRSLISETLQEIIDLCNEYNRCIEIERNLEELQTVSSEKEEHLENVLGGLSDLTISPLPSADEINPNSHFNSLLSYGEVKLFSTNIDACSENSNNVELNEANDINQDKTIKETILVLENALHSHIQSVPFLKILFEFSKENNFDLHLTGGFIRDFGLKLVKPNDYDFKIHCNVDKFIAIFSAFEPYQPAPHVRASLVRLKALDNANLSNDIVCLEGDEQFIDDYDCNTIRFDGEKIVKSNGVAALLSPTLTLYGNVPPFVRMQQDPCLILRTIRIANLTNKTIPDDVLFAMNKQHHLATSLNFTLYCANLGPLFLRSYEQAQRNLSFIIDKQWLSCLLPPALAKTSVFAKYVTDGSLLNHVKILYDAHTKEGEVDFFEKTPYYKKLTVTLVALCLLPFVQSKRQAHPDLYQCINETIEHFSDNFSGLNDKKLDKSHAKRKLSDVLKSFFSPQVFVPQFRHLSRQQQFDYVTQVSKNELGAAMRRPI